MASVPGFLSKTYQIFNNPEFSDCCGWGANGDTIVVTKIEAFSKQVLPQYFKHSNFQSFVRQLNMYDFHKTMQDPTHGEFKHPYFRKDRPDLLVMIKRKAHTRMDLAPRKRGGSEIRDVDLYMPDSYSMQESTDLSNADDYSQYDHSSLIREVKKFEEKCLFLSERVTRVETEQSILFSENAKLKESLQVAHDNQQALTLSIKRVIYNFISMCKETNIQIPPKALSVFCDNEALLGPFLNTSSAKKLLANGESVPSSQVFAQLLPSSEETSMSPSISPSLLSNEDNNGTITNITTATNNSNSSNGSVSNSRGNSFSNGFRSGFGSGATVDYTKTYDGPSSSLYMNDNNNYNKKAWGGDSLSRMSSFDVKATAFDGLPLTKKHSLMMSYDGSSLGSPGTTTMAASIDNPAEATAVASLEKLQSFDGSLMDDSSDYIDSEELVDSMEKSHEANINRLDSLETVLSSILKGGEGSGAELLEPFDSNNISSTLTSTSTSTFPSSSPSISLPSNNAVSEKEVAKSLSSLAYSTSTSVSAPIQTSTATTKTAISPASISTSSATPATSMTSI